MIRKFRRFFKAQVCSGLLCILIAGWSAAAVQAQTPPEEFRTFVDTYLGAKNEPLRYVYSGETLAFVSESEWTHVSENSVAIAFETTLPSKTYVEYGTTTSFSKRTALDDRFTSLHLHHLAGLQMGQKIYFRFVAEDERGNTIRSTVREATPAAIPGARHIPGDVAGPPYVLTVPGYYVVTADINAPTRGFTIKTSGVTLDLNGHRLLYDTGDPLVVGTWADYVYSDLSTFGVLAEGLDWKILNGVIEQDPLSAGGGHIGYGFNPIYGGGYAPTEVAGVVARYSGADTGGIIVRGGAVSVHHNIVDDRGSQMADRHFGIKAIEGDQGRTAYNLVLRTRHIGIAGGQEIVGNEIYVDSYAVNGFAIGPRRLVSQNKIFGTGYHVVGVGWCNNLTFSKNFIHLVGPRLFDRSDEMGPWCSLNGIRTTQYNGGTDVYENGLYQQNFVSVIAASACKQARGIQLASDAFFKNFVVRDNVFRATLLDPETPQPSIEMAAVVAHGLSNRIPDTIPILYFDNTVISNYRLFNFGDSYTAGSKHYFIRSRLVREGSVASFKPIGVGFWIYDTLDNRILSSTLEGDINLEDAYFQSSGRQEYSVGAAAHIRALDCGGAPLLSKPFTVRDSRGTVLQGTTDAATGEAVIQVLHYTMVGSPSSRQGVKVPHENPELHLDGYKAVPLSSQLMASGASPQSPARVRFVRTGESCPAAGAPAAPKNLRMGR